MRLEPTYNGQHRRSRSPWFQEHLATDGHETARKKCPQGSGIPRRDLGPNQRTPVTSICRRGKTGTDQGTTGATVAIGVVVQLDGELQPTGETAAEGEQPAVVTEHAHIPTVGAGALDAWVVFEVAPFDGTLTGSCSGDQHRVE